MLIKLSLSVCLLILRSPIDCIDSYFEIASKTKGAVPKSQMAVIAKGYNFLTLSLQIPGTVNLHNLEHVT